LGEKTKMTNILVTGGCGFIGSNLVDLLLENENNNVVVIDNLDTGKVENCNERAKYIFRDIRDVFPIKGSNADYDLIKETDIVFHLAALARIQPSFERPTHTLDINTKGTGLVCEFARKHNAKVVYAGSSSFYGGVYLNPYAFSKWQGEEICKLYSEVYGVNTAIARFFNVYGPRHLCDGPYATVVGIFERQILNKEPLTITGTGEQRRDFTNVKDICRGLIKMSEDNWKGEIFNLGTGTNYSINELAKMFKDDIKYIPKRPGEAWETLADISKTKDLLNWIPEAQLKTYVSEWIQHNT
jgi:UDP-glucose 4-epimerase